VDVVVNFTLSTDWVDSMEEHNLPGAAILAEIKEMIGRARTIAAIMRLREATGCSLADAKMWVDRDLEGLGIGRDRINNPCPYCGKPLRSAKARQCFECRMDWHHVHD
jgi:hypothetical protein